MASIKSLINSTLSSYRDSHKSIPKDSYISATITFDQGIDAAASYIAPCDGLITVQMDKTKSDSIGLILRLNESLDVCRDSDFSHAGWCVCSTIARKGQRFYWRSDTNSPGTKGVAYVRIYPMIGGGSLLIVVVEGGSNEH